MLYTRLTLRAAPYNTGSKITRGAARIVYSRFYRNGSSDGAHIDNLEEIYVFYTYNHYTPTPYVDVVRQNFKLLGL